MEEEHILNEYQSTLFRRLTNVIIPRARVMLTACATMEKNPFKIRATRYELKLVAAAH